MSRRDRFLLRSLALAAAGSLLLAGCSTTTDIAKQAAGGMDEAAKQAASGAAQQALGPAAAPVLDLLKQAEADLKAGNLGAAVTAMGGFQALWDKAGPVIQPLAGDKWGGIDTAAKTVISTFRKGAKPDAAAAGAAAAPGPWSAMSNTITTPPAGTPSHMAIQGGDGQSVPRGDLPSIPGGQANFSPLLIKITDDIGRPVPGVDVAYSIGAHPNSMAVQIHPSGSRDRVTVKTDADGIATLNRMNGHSVTCYYAEGAFTITAAAIGATQTFNLTVAPTLPPPSYPDARLTVVSGNNQVLSRTPEEGVTGGIAKFAPLQVKVTNTNGQPMPNVMVAFRAGRKPSGMAVQVDPSGGEPTAVNTDENGIATLKKFSGGHGVYVYYATGAFTVIAHVEGAPEVSINGQVSG